MRLLTITAAVAVVLAAMAVPADAQMLRVNPRIGLYMPATDLGEVTGDRVSLDNSLAYGLGLELALPLLPFNIRANLDYASEATVTEDGVDQDAGRTTVLAVVGDAVFRLPRILMVQPYLFAGGGLKQYDFDTSEPDRFRDASDPTIHLGGGLDLGFRTLSITAQLSDYISWYELQGDDSRTQHDLFLTLGFSVTMF
jgi:hypothetical protein